jgi:LacI family transcriptional regulator
MRREPGIIGVLASYDMQYYRDVVRGVMRFETERKGWLHHVERPDEGGLESLTALRPAGIIAVARTVDFARALGRARAPVVVVSKLVDLPRGRPFSRFHSVQADDVEVGRLAAEHLIEAGFGNFAFVGAATVFSRERLNGYRAALRAKGLACLEMPERGKLSESLPVARIGSLLASAPRPLGVFACSDGTAYRLAAACRLTGVRVPDEVAIVGADNDELVCEGSDPALSSVPTPAFEIGYRAARLVADLAHRKHRRPRQAIVPPLPVVRRRSTEVTPTDDSELLPVLRYVRDHAHESIGVSQIARVFPMSRRKLEMKFRRSLGRSPHEEIARVRLERAKNLLATTERTQQEIAGLTGFSSASHMSSAFRRRLDLTPGEYRQRCAAGVSRPRHRAPAPPR